jgi:ElaB/YqjD/DUF883 family membrane-anchored ribosome-binding protein
MDEPKGTGTKTAQQSKIASGAEPLPSANQPNEPGRADWKTGLERDLETASQRGAEIIENAKQTFSDAYDKTGKALGTTYERAKEYGTEHPGTMTLVALGVGVGIGFMLAQNTRMSSRSRAQRIVPPVMNALSQVVTELFD